MSGMIPYKKDLVQGIDYVRDKYKAGKIIAIADEATKDLEIAVAKATNHDEVPPKEKHIRTLITMCGPGEPRAQVQMAVQKLAKRAHNNHGWLVTLKCLMSFHRLMRETDAAFMNEVLAYSDRTGYRGVVRLDNYKDIQSTTTWDYSSWIRVYSIFLDERLELFRLLKFDIQVEKSIAATKIREMSSDHLLDILPKLQKAQTHLTGCVPEGAAKSSPVVMEAVVMIVKESFRLYHILSEGIICLVDRFFDMDRIKAQKALEIYKSAIDGNDSIQTFYGHIKNLDGNVSRMLQFPELSPPPEDFLVQMEEYIASAPVDASMDYSPSRNAGAQSRARQSKMSSPALAHAKQSSAAPSKLGAFPSPLGNQQPAEDLLKDLDINDNAPQTSAAGAGSADPFGGGAFGGGGKDFFGSSSSNDPFASPAPDMFGGSVTTTPAKQPHQQPYQQSADPFAHPSASGNSFGGAFAAHPPAAPSASGSFFDSPFAGSPAQATSGSSGTATNYNPNNTANNNPFGAPANNNNNPFATTASSFSSPHQPPQPVTDLLSLGGTPSPGMRRPSDPFAPSGGGGGGGGGLFGGSPVQSAPSFPLQQVPVVRQHAPPAPANPFAQSGLQQHMLSHQSKKSVADPFAELSMLGGAPAPKKSSPAGAAPMRGGQSPNKPQWTSPPSGSQGSDPFANSGFF